MAKPTRYNYEALDVICEVERISPNKVCTETGIASATISNWKLGKYTPKDDKVQKIADYFEVDIEFFKKFDQRDRLLEYYRKLKKPYVVTNNVINIPNNFGSNIIFDKISQDPVLTERVMMLYALPKDKQEVCLDLIETTYNKYIQKKEAISNE